MNRLPATRAKHDDQMWTKRRDARLLSPELVRRSLQMPQA